jgi:hypothetical protein
VVETNQQQSLKPRSAIRRFDVFAEYSRQKALHEEHLPPDEAKGYGIWLAKVVAARRSGRREQAAAPPPSASHRETAAAEPASKFRAVGDELQTDATFDREIIDRMGKQFYAETFAPAIAAARARGERYEDIRDRIRAGWKAVKPETS